MTLHERDYPLLKAFIRSEAEDYMWKNGIEGPESKSFQDRVFAEIVGYQSASKLNYVHVFSLSNMGSVAKRLTLTAENWGWKRDLLVILGTTPRDKINFMEAPSQGSPLFGWNEETGVMEG